MPSPARIPNLPLRADLWRNGPTLNTDEIAARAIAECVADNYGKTAYEAQLLAELALERIAEAGLLICRIGPAMSEPVYDSPCLPVAPH